LRAQTISADTVSPQVFATEPWGRRRGRGRRRRFRAVKLGDRTQQFAAITEHVSSAERVSV